MEDPFGAIRMLEDVTELVDEGLMDLYDNWNWARHGASLPASLDPLDCPHVLPRCAVVDVRGRKSILEGVIKFAGSLTVKSLGKDITGLQVSNLINYPYIFRLLTSCGTLRCAVYTDFHQIAYQPESPLFVQEICLPLSRDGKALSELVIAFSPKYQPSYSSDKGEHLYRNSPDGSFSRSRFDNIPLTH